jgi:hypothetical protein
VGDGHVFVNAVPCPVCGNDAFSEGSDEVCEHLVADWAWDTDDNGGGVLGGGTVGGPAGVDDLATACQSLSTVVLDADDSVHENRVTALREAVPVEQRPSWWPVLCDAIADLDNEPISDAPEQLGRVPTSIALDVLGDAPVLVFTANNLGTMAGGMWSYAWSEDPNAAHKEMADRVSSATEIIKRATATLEARFSPRM